MSGPSAARDEAMEKSRGRSARARSGAASPAARRRWEVVQKLKQRAPLAGAVGARRPSGEAKYSSRSLVGAARRAAVS